ncbi:hypothetical protein [Streptomyces hirsutus]|nr:hypothetical protein [Streptomyces hirsutus]
MTDAERTAPVHVEAGNIGITAGAGASVSPEGLAVDGVLAVSQY